MENVGKIDYTNKYPHFNIDSASKSIHSSSLSVAVCGRCRSERHVFCFGLVIALAFAPGIAVTLELDFVMFLSFCQQLICNTNEKGGGKL